MEARGKGRRMKNQLFIICLVSVALVMGMFWIISASYVENPKDFSELDFKEYSYGLHLDVYFQSSPEDLVKRKLHLREVVSVAKTFDDWHAIYKMVPHDELLCNERIRRSHKDSVVDSYYREVGFDGMLDTAETISDWGYVKDIAMWVDIDIYNQALSHLPKVIKEISQNFDQDFAEEVYKYWNPENILIYDPPVG